MSEAKPARNWGIFLWLVISQAVYALSLIPWIVMAMMSFMAFDSGVYLSNSLFVAAVWSYPLWLILFSALAWVSYKRGKNTPALIWTSIPMLIILAASILLSL